MDLLITLLVAVAMSMEEPNYQAPPEPIPVVIYDTPSYELIRCTCYLDTGITYSGTRTRQGVAAGCKDWIGETVKLYENDNGEVGDYIGTYVIEDTGFGIKGKDGKGSLQKGESIDIWQPSQDAINEWIKAYGDYVFIEFEQ